MLSLGASAEPRPGKVVAAAAKPGQGFLLALALSTNCCGIVRFKAAERPQPASPWGLLPH